MCGRTGLKKEKKIHLVQRERCPVDMWSLNFEFYEVSLEKSSV